MTFLKRWAAIVCAIMCGIAALPLMSHADTESDMPLYADDSIIVVLKSGYTSLGNGDASVGGNIPTAPGDEEDLAKDLLDDDEIFYELLSSDTHYRTTLRISLESDVENAVAESIAVLSQNPRVLSVTPNYLYTPDVLTDDPYYDGTQDNMRAVYEQVEAEAAWKLTKGSRDVSVGIIDSGIAAHEDLTANLVQGYDFVNDSPVTDDDPTGHGTHMAGIIGAVGNNGIGTTGISPTVSLVPLQVTKYPGSYSYDTASIIKAILYAHVHGIDILNCSFSSTQYDHALYRAMQVYRGLIVCSTGNSADNLTEKPHYPAAFDLPNILSVASVNRHDALAASSGYGRQAVDLAAPGTDILSTVPGGYAAHSGTSVATAFVSGGAALLKAYNPHLTATDLKSILLRSVDTLDSLTETTVSGGRLNLRKALKRTVKGDNVYTLNTVVSVDIDEALRHIRFRIRYNDELLDLHSVRFDEAVSAHAIYDYSVDGEVLIAVAPPEPMVLSSVPVSIVCTTRQKIPADELTLCIEAPTAADADGNAVSPALVLSDALLGDVNDDGCIDTSDCRRALLHINGYETIRERALLAMDVNRDSAVNLADATAMLFFTCELLHTFL